MDIGNKIKNARMNSSLTQEQAAEALGVSRQTISNWENEKTYPDIISVIKMSDLYAISLDHLLKEEKPMSNYLDYLEESTNVVKSKKKLSEIITLIAYLIIWAISLILFWVFATDSDAMAYGLLVFWLVLPVSSFVISLIVGKNSFWGKFKWASPLFFGLMYMLADYGTYRLANNIAFDKINAPEFELFFYGAVISLVGLLAGFAFSKLGKKFKNKNS